MNTIIIIILMIICYSCFELSFKKLFKFFLKGKKSINFGDENEEEEEELEEDEEEPLKDNCDGDED